MPQVCGGWHRAILAGSAGAAALQPGTAGAAGTTGAAGMAGAAGVSVQAASASLLRLHSMMSEFSATCGCSPCMLRVEQLSPRAKFLLSRVLITCYSPCRASLVRL